MKKTFLLLTVFSFLFISANAQIQKGQKMIGGELTLSSYEEDGDFVSETKSTTIMIAPEIGFGLANNWVVGAGLLFSNQVQKNGSASVYAKYTTNVSGISVFGRKFHPFTENVGIFGELDIALGFGKRKYKEVQGSITSTMPDRNVTTSIASLNPGFYFKPTRRLIFEANFGGFNYISTTTKLEGPDKSKNNQFNFNLTSNIGLSFRVIL